MATASIPDVPAKPHQPLSFAFPKRALEKRKWCTKAMDALDLKCVINEFIGDSTHRAGIFAKYSEHEHA